MAKTLEKHILSLLSDAPEGARYDVYAFELWREPEGGWSVNSGWRMASRCTVEEILPHARGRWGIFKVNYAPRARVQDIEDGGGGDEESYYLEVDCTTFLELRRVES